MRISSDNNHDHRAAVFSGTNVAPPLPVRPAGRRAVSPRRRATLLLVLALACASTAIGGCQTTTTDVTAGGARRTSPTPDASRVTTEPPRSEAADAGDGTTRATPSVRRNDLPGRTADPLDPCAERLHALCGPLLFYYVQNRQLPPTLQDLEGGPEPIPPLICPDSHKPYVYLLKNPIPIDNPRGHILLHDAVAAHDGVRWTIVVSPGANPTELIAKAVGIREDRFAVLRSQTTLPADGK
jgi:hypothetical protein